METEYAKIILAIAESLRAAAAADAAVVVEQPPEPPPRWSPWPSAAQMIKDALGE
jgi:sugar phosphate isomerase/epimerase